YRGKLLLKCKFGDSSDEEPAATPGLLMRVIELREQLATARANAALDEVERLAAEVRERRGVLLSEIAQAFGRLSAQAANDRALAVAALKAQLGELKYLERFVDEV